MWTHYNDCSPHTLTILYGLYILIAQPQDICTKNQYHREKIQKS